LATRPAYSAAPEPLAGFKGPLRGRKGGHRRNKRERGWIIPLRQFLDAPLLSTVAVGKESVPKTVINDTISLFLNCKQHFGNLKPVPECCLIKLLPYILFEKNILIF